MNAVEFHAPVFVGDLVNFFTETTRVGRTSITVKVVVEAERWGAGQGERVRVTEAEVVLVAIGPDGVHADRRYSDAPPHRMIAVYAPGSVSNVACGFDVLGFALDEPGDVVIAAPQDASGVSIAAIHGDDGRLTLDPRKNTGVRGGAGAAAAARDDPRRSR